MGDFKIGDSGRVVCCGHEVVWGNVGPVYYLRVLEDKFGVKVVLLTNNMFGRSAEHVWELFRNSSKGAEILKKVIRSLHGRINTAEEEVCYGKQ